MFDIEGKQNKSMKAIRVFYDMQEGTYFQIHKQTGSMQKAQSNGSFFPRFKPQYTGSDYKIRKENQKSLSPPVLRRPPFQVRLEHKHTFSTQHLRGRRQQKSSNLRRMQQGKENWISQRGSFLTNEGPFDKKLKKFAELKQKLRYENHSPKKQIEGSIYIPRKSLINFTQKILDSDLGKKYRKEKLSKSASALTRVEMPESLQIQNQVRRQKEIFLKYNPRAKRQLKFKQDELRERKINMLIFEKLQIKNSERQTSLVYS